jgi:hypothetical protein
MPSRGSPGDRVPRYRPPATASMIARQDSISALRLLLAQRKLYNRAKRWSFLRWIGFSVIGVAAPILTVILPRAAAVVGAVAGIWIFLSRTWFSSAEQARAAKAAHVQEQFDQFVFAMPDRIRRTPAATIEEVASLVGNDQSVTAEARKDRLTGWYPFDTRVDGAMSVAIAQRANAAYSERLLSTNATVWLATTLAWSGGAVVVSVIVGLTLSQFLLGATLPLLPALLDVWEQYRSTRRAGELRRTMAISIEDAVRGQAEYDIAPEDLLVWQNQLYDLRRRSPQVPNLVYRRVRARNEQAMNTAAEELAAVVLHRSADGQDPAGEC